MFTTWGQGGVEFEPKKGGARTAIGSFPVRVWVVSASCLTQTRLRGKNGVEPSLGCARAEI